MYTDQYVRESLELHLFSGRIMKEHALFLEAGFTPANEPFAKQAEMYKKEFEKLLRQAVALAEGRIQQEFWNAEEAVTAYTAEAEQQTQMFTGIAIDGAITRKERRMAGESGLRRGCGPRCGQAPQQICGQDAERMCNQDTGRIRRQIHAMNQTALRLLDGLICFKETVLENVLSCRMFTMNYPLLIEHIIRETKLYRENVESLERIGRMPRRTDWEEEAFWNRIMMEHALFIRGLLDPTQEELIQSADGFAKAYEALLEVGSGKDMGRAPEIGSLEETVRFQEFKTAGTQGILGCKIRSVILPLLADHVLREVNHYLRILRG